MPTTDDVDLAALDLATADLVDALTTIDDGDETLPTPCKEWNLADLVDHLTGGNWYTIRVLGGASSDDALAATMADFAEGSVTIANATRSAIDQREAFHGPGALEQTWDHVAGALTGRQMLRLRLHDLIVHTWDLNETCRPPAAIPEALAGWGQRELQNPESLMSKHFGLPPIDTDQAPPVGAVAAYQRVFGRRTTAGGGST